MSNPYHFDSSDPNAVRFQTSHGIGYLVYFLPSPDFFADYPEFSEDAVTFGLAVEENPLAHLPKDARIGETIRVVLRGYFQQNPTGILLFTIDNKDKRQAARKKLFDRWYEQENSLGIERKSGIVAKGPHETSFGLFYNAKHPHKGLIIASVESFLLEMKGKE